MTNSGWLQIGDVAGPLKDANNKTVVPIPKSGNALSIANATFGQIYSFNYNFTTKLTTTLGGSPLAPDGTVSYKINTPPQNPISDADGHVLKLNANVMGFSSNGRYLIIDAPNLALIRVDLTTGVVTPFGSSFIYPNGVLSKAGFLAISDDGTIAAVSAQDRLQVYDLSTCASVPSTIIGPVSCDVKNLYSLWTSAAPGASILSYLGFVDRDTLYGYTSVSSPGGRSKYYITSYGHTITTQQYLALGDSYSSGEGAYNYELGTDTSDNKCHLSKQSYPYLIAGSQDYSAWHSVACSRATSANVVGGEVQYPIVPIPNSLGSWMPGITDQLQKVELSNPDIITIGIGGNDIQFDDLVAKCTFDFGATCYSSYDSRTELIDLINNQYSKLRNEYATIKSLSKPTTKVYVIGYPQIVNPASNHCGNTFLNAEEIALSNQIVNHLNYVIEQAAIGAGVQYVDVSSALNGHQLCDPMTANRAVNGITVGQEIKNVVGAESYHPSLLGQVLLKNAVMSATSDFGTYAPGNPANAVIPSRTSATALALRGPYTTPDNGTIRVAVPLKELPRTTYKDEGLDFVLDHITSTLGPNKTYTVTIHSNPTVLGTFTTDSLGNLDVNTAIPSTVDTGIHTLEITGTNVAGQPVVAYQIIAVGETKGDFDGNGIADSLSDCIFISNTPQDIDDDGVDDGCDDIVGRAPSDINSLYRARQGNPANAESADAVYVERNTALADSMLGINDYDADSDGWSVIGITTSGQEGSFANLKIEDIGLTVNSYDEYKPIISARTSTDGCITLTPTSLGQVTSTSPTTLATTATNTSTCRSAAADADLDSNGTPDNQQSLYRLRAGDTLLGESASDLYIERNIQASEAALGISDYDDNADGWAKIATFSSAYAPSNIGLYDSASETVVLDGTTALTSNLLNTYSKAERRTLVPIVAMADGATCYNYRPNNLSLVTLNQIRGISSLSANVLACNP